MGTLSLNDYEDVSIPLPWGHLAGRWYGNRRERPILALHGWQDNLGTFDTLIPLLPDYLGILCIDLPGHGHSSRLPKGIQYDFVNFAFIIGRVMQEFKWSKVSLLGHSMGAILSLIYSSLAPHTVDLVILIEGVINPFARLDLDISAFNIERCLQEVDRMAINEATNYEPTSYSMEHFCQFVHTCTVEAVPVELAPHLLKRSVHRSQLYPDKYYTLKDNRTKCAVELQLSLGLAAEMARCIREKPVLILKGAESPFMCERDEEVISILRAQNPDLEFHELQGNHYIHLCNPTACAAHIVPFLRRHRPHSRIDNSHRKQHKL
ncbi:probable serine hydrolase [Drosophila albomicans]|uniref:Probable serine hydrolase n=1 Tax=Drosophila albomicans TaxID=7291 RepID=A0A6P8Z0X9_DROAB|nr:probable serine hydrolase [Drosophila albomicans]